ncbi:MAG: hypothetical protein JWR26_2053 [Pedosphaera sp.]|nr:hypothetical protein [Pedosphaera sp.]
MERGGLPAAARLFVDAAKLAFPKSYPILDRNRQIAWRAKKVNMIRHQQIIADKPSIRGLPSFTQMLVGIGLRKPGLTVPGANIEKDNGRASQFNVNSLCWLMSPDISIG